MVRLVFRPYTQVWRAICTLAPLRASIRVSPDFTLLRHSSPSFGSYQICSYSNLSYQVGRSCCLRWAPFTFISRIGFYTSTLAYRIDSLVRVSRRDSKYPFGKITVVPQAAHILSGFHLFWYAQLDFALRFVLPNWDVISIDTHFASKFYRFLLNDFRSFHSLFKVLFIFPSQYLFAIGFPLIFSFGRIISPT